MASSWLILVAYEGRQVKRYPIGGAVLSYFQTKSKTGGIVPEIRDLKSRCKAAMFVQRSR